MEAISGLPRGAGGGRSEILHRSGSNFEGGIVVRRRQGIKDFLLRYILLYSELQNEVQNEEEAQ